MIDPITISMLGGWGFIVALLMWNIKRIDDVRKEVTILHTNDMYHIENSIRTIETDISDIKLRIQTIASSMRKDGKSDSRI